MSLEARQLRVQLRPFEKLKKWRKKMSVRIIEEEAMAEEEALITSEKAREDMRLEKEVNLVENEVSSPTQAKTKAESELHSEELGKRSVGETLTSVVKPTQIIKDLTNAHWC
ncbi:uncharacterized protein A4U43_C06F8980 [Asparagus officinalis]|uniref:Uncharacterized protein n=1 Tax=Asparagus officinalis TaxID=4686 RepID=A0A5P1EL65_ASPOF|nr:uncharacterized protein A4U43_C06F8980 [Asparagus officinalis]